MPAPGRLRVHALIDTLGVGGAEMVLAEFAAVAQLAGIELSVGYLAEAEVEHAAARLRRAGVQPRRVGIPGHLGPAAFLAVRRQIAQLRPDVVHTHLGYADLLGGLAARSLGIPTVATLHGDVDLDNRRARLRRDAMRLARRVSAERLIAVSEAARAAYVAGGSYPPGRVVVVRNGIAGTALPGAGQEVRRELGLEPEHLVVAMISSLRREKAHDLAFAAVRELVVSMPEVRLLVVGDGRLRAEVARAAKPLGDRVVLAGFRDDTMAVLDATDVLLHPSRHDALPTTIIEAMAAGTPVLATRVGGIPELIDDGVSGILLAPPPVPSEIAAVLAGLLRDPARRRQLAAAGRARFEREFTARRWAICIEELYRDVLSS